MKKFTSAMLTIIFVFPLLTTGCAKKQARGPGVKAASSIQQGQSLTNSMGMKFEYIAPGTFIMGSPADETESPDDEMQHTVTLTKGFYMQTTEVTVGQWRSFVRDTGYKSEAEINGGAYVLTTPLLKRKKGKYWDNPDFSQTDQHPVTCVSWNDAQAFIKWLNQKEGHTYRLPTEAEWEYACRAGTDTPFSLGRSLSTDQANYDGNFPLPGCLKGEYRKETVPVAGFSPNPWGLYDMHGNVWEWCRDWWALYPSGHVIDPKGPSSGSRWIPNRVSRGGSWLFGAAFCRSGYRFMNMPSAGDDTQGFRLVRDP
ncbi:MAG: formylglycine-generating enzyme family protein [Desulfobacterales bacterium]|nr:formylglycine-generating enzyme family protein [Desulfobacterales bacterium]